ncbi:restriction endonuclease subunit S [Pseudomonas sp. GWSMS-1]|uniref:restriction endonuclease subunit S n=1 Tax=Pseudomonas sp. GWSMS-1 TaxID=3308997 RepID=UPI003CE7A751
MTGNYRAYPEYKDSGIEWLGDVPEHWGNVPIKYMALESESLFLDGDWIESKDISGEGIRYITTGNVTNGKYREQGAGYITEDTFLKLNCTEVLEGDVLIARLNDPIGRACIVPNLESKIVTSVDNVIFRPDKKYQKNYLVHLFSSEGYFRHTGNLARGATMQRISRGLLGNIRIVTPLFEEQEKIANFLDHETAKIDTLIEKQQQLIQLLKEKRQAVISHAVTKGLSSLNGGPNAKMRDSGVEWLGEVPEHWKVSPIKWYSSIKSGENLPANEIESIKDEEFCYPVYGGNGILGYAKKSNLKTTAIVIGRVGALCGNVHKTEELSWISDNALILNVNASVFSFDYIALCLEVRDLNKLADKNAQPLITGTKVTNEYVPIPPVDEQREIEGRVIGMMRHFEVLSSQAETGIALLQERRTALISAAVTGKIDVRDWVAPQTSPTHKEVAA